MILNKSNQEGSPEDLKQTTLDNSAEIYQKRKIETEKEKLTQMNWKQKLQYFKDYYLLKCIIITGLASLLLYIVIYSLIPKPEPIVSITSINFGIDKSKTDAFTKEALDYLGYNNEEYTISLDTDNSYKTSDQENAISSNYGLSEKFTAMIMANQMDLFICDSKSFAEFFPQGFYADLKNLLPKSLMDKLGSDVIIAKSPQLEADAPLALSLNNSSVIRKLFTIDEEALKEKNITSEELLDLLLKDYYIGIIYNSVNKEEAVRFIEYLYSDVN